MLTDADDTKSCCALFQAFYNETKPYQPWFLAKEPSTQRLLDIPESFCRRTPLVLVTKFVACAYIVSTQVLAVLATEDIAFFWAYLTTVIGSFSCIYSVISVCNSIIPVSQPDGECVQVRIKFMWIMFVLSVFGQAFITLLFWSLEYEWGHPVEYLDIARHGIVFVVVFLEGFVVNRIPLRWMHIWLCWALTLAYITWSVLHGPLVFDMGNPLRNDNDPSTNDDALYPALSWDDDDIMVRQ